MAEEKLPRKAYVLVCTGDHCRRQGNPDGIRVRLRQALRLEGVGSKAKVIAVSCLGLCGQGPNVIVGKTEGYIGAVKSNQEHVDQIMEIVSKSLKEIQ